MPFETIACSQCGSGDVQEVKPSIYFCNHCESVFKYVDPTRLTVRNAPVFCACGGAVEVQCQVCNEGSCRSCDVMEWKRRRDRKNLEATGRLGLPPSPGFRDYLPFRLHVPVAGYGYLIKTYSAASEGIAAIVNGRIVRVDIPSSRTMGPFLYLDELLATLQATDLSHVCCSCVVSAIPRTAEHIASHTMCEMPGCGRRANAKCRCCGASFCAGHLAPTGLADCREPARSGYVQAGTVHAVQSNLCGGDYHGIKWLIPDGMCLGCVEEKALDAQSAVEAGLREYGLSAEPGTWSSRFEIRAARHKSSRRQRTEDVKVLEDAPRYAQEMTRRLKASIIPGACKRAQLLHGPMRGLSSGVDMIQYAIVDERASVLPAAARTDTETL